MINKPITFKLKKFEIGFCLLLFFISGFVYYLTSSFPAFFREQGFGPGFLPRLIVVLMSLLALILLISNLLDPNKKTIEITISNWNLILIVLLMVVVNALLFNVFGYVISTFVFLAITMLILKTNIKLTLFYSCLFTLLIYIVFAVFLKIPM